MCEHLFTAIILLFPFLFPVLWSSQPVFQIHTPDTWHQGKSYGTTDLLQGPNHEIELLYSDGAFFRQKLSARKAIILEATQLVDLTDFGVRSSNLRSTTDLAKTHGVQFRHEDFLGSDKKFALRQDLTFRECKIFCRFNKAKIFDDLSSVSEMHNVFPTIHQFWIKVTQNSTILSSTAAIYQVSALFDGKLSEIYPQNKLSNSTVSVYYFENF